MSANRERALRTCAQAISDIRRLYHPTRLWDVPGVAAVLNRIPIEVDLARVMHAAIEAARTRGDQASPAVIAMDGPHWRESPTDAGPTPAEMEASEAESRELHRRLIEMVGLPEAEKMLQREAMSLRQPTSKLSVKRSALATAYELHRARARDASSTAG